MPRFGSGSRLYSSICIFGRISGVFAISSTYTAGYRKQKKAGLSGRISGASLHLSVTLRLLSELYNYLLFRFQHALTVWPCLDDLGGEACSATVCGACEKTKVDNLLPWMWGGRGWRRINMLWVHEQLVRVPSVPEPVEPKSF